MLDSLQTTTTTTERVCGGWDVHVDITPGARGYCVETNYSFQLFAEQNFYRFQEISRDFRRFQQISIDFSRFEEISRDLKLFQGISRD